MPQARSNTEESSPQLRPSIPPPSFPPEETWPLLRPDDCVPPCLIPPGEPYEVGFVARTTSHPPPVATTSTATCIDSGCCVASGSLQGRCCNELMREQENDSEKGLWYLRMLALLGTLFLGVGDHYSAHILGALKATIKQEMDISNTQYGILQSCVSIVNTVLPILGGVFIDRFGTGPGSLIATSLITAGSVCIAFSTHLNSFPVMFLGRLLFGLGSGTIFTIQGTILSHWFRGNGLSIAISLEISISRLTSFLSMATAIPIANYYGFYGYAFWASTVVCTASLIINVAYVWLVRKMHHQNIQQATLEKLKRNHRFKPRLLLALPALYWLVTSEAFLLDSGKATFLHINSELIKLRYGYSDKIAAYYASLAQVLPIFLGPVMGVFLDRSGKRIFTIILSGLSFTAASLIAGFTKFPPAVGMLILSVAIALGPLSLISSIAILLPLDVVGTGIGIFKSTRNIGSTIFDIVAGRLQDLQHTYNPNDPIHAYDYVMVFLTVLGTLGVLTGFVILHVNRAAWHNLLQLADRERAAWYERYSQEAFRMFRITRQSRRRRHRNRTEHDPLILDARQDSQGADQEAEASLVNPDHPIRLRDYPWWSWLCNALLLIGLITSWVIFLTFLFIPRPQATP